MKVKEIVRILDARILCGEDMQEYTVEKAFASDLMSDVLMLADDNVLLITGLVNMQTIRTAEMSDILCVVLARNKKASREMIDLARDGGIILIECRYSVYQTCGLLYREGLKPIF